jgi:hypothetical protein
METLACQDELGSRGTEPNRVGSCREIAFLPFLHAFRRPVSNRPRPASFNLRAKHLGFVEDEVALGEVLIHALRFLSVSRQTTNSPFYISLPMM